MEYTLRSQVGGTILMKLPDSNRTPVKAVREAVAKFEARAKQHREARAEVAASEAAVDRARAAIATEAADAAEDGGAVPAKKLVKRLRDATDAYDEARIELDARDSALRKAHQKLRETIVLHTPAWRAAVIDSLDADILKLATLHGRLRDLANDLEEHVGVTGLLTRLPIDYQPVLMLEAGAPSMAIAHLSEALGRLTDAVGAASTVLNVTREAAKAKAAEPADEKPTEAAADESVAITAEGDDDVEA